MIDYKLALELKGAGFPGSEEWKAEQGTMTFKTPYDLTLEKVIEACGDRFKGLIPAQNVFPNANGYFAVVEIGKINENGTWIEWSFITGKTHLEAVSKLYIALT